MCGLVPHHDDLFLNIVFKLQKLSFKKICESDVKIWERAPWGVVGSGGGRHVWKEQEETGPSLLDSGTCALEICVFSSVVLQERGEKVMGSPSVLTG